jgi:hypothetical protein
MDPKTAQLDSKLRETYERVMGTATPQSQQSSTQNQATPPPIDTPIQEEMIKGQAMEQNDLPENAVNTENLRFQAAIQQNLSEDTPSPSETTQQIATQKKTSTMLKTLYIIGIIIFFIVYTYFWIKIFDLPVPF